MSATGTDTLGDEHGRALIDRLVRLPADERDRLLKRLTHPQVRMINDAWEVWAHPLLQYETVRDFRDCRLSFRWRCSG